MTQHKNLKRRIRQRMEKTGESYASARRITLQQAPLEHDHSLPLIHMPGNVPAASALRVLLANAGLRAEHTGKPFSEAMIFGIAGGIGAGVFAFHYEKENLSTFFIAGRHLWQDDLAYLRQAAERFGASAEVAETGGAKQAAANLDERLADGGPVIAWVDMAELGTRGLPETWSGGGYHVVVVYRREPDAQSYLIGDLADQPVRLSAGTLATARARIKKDKNRLLRLANVPQSVQLLRAITAGLQACHQGLVGGRMQNFTLEAFAKWAKELRAQAKGGWGQQFPPGPNLWRGLTSVYDFIEHYGTGGGLCRPLFADFLEEAGQALGSDLLEPLAIRYRRLGQGWSELAQAALPDEIEVLAQARRLLDEKAERYLSEGATARQDYEQLWAQLMALAGQGADQFPLVQAEAETLRHELADRVEALYDEEQAGLAAIEQAVRQLVD